MKFMTTDDIRLRFINFFSSRDHEKVPSSSLVPHNDDTLLFTNAGMVQFKDLFLGIEKRPYTRATTFQRCVRAGGKHNDLEQVGYTKRHHTFFEMLGNFSFGDYFKREAIQFAWDFLTKELGIPADKLWVTVYQDDSETETIWIDEMGVSPQRLSRCGEKDNFWSMGETGPCGPCTEIFYDHGPEVAGGPPGSSDQDGDRYVEVWNLVFMQYNRNSAGELHSLPKPCVDTGMGLERIACVMQGAHDNYEIDVFKHLLAAVSELTHCDDFSNKSMRAIADHIRSCAFLIVDGVVPSNEGRGYVLRRILRRAIRHGYKLGVDEIFFYKLVESLVLVMGKAFPNLEAKQQFIENCLKQEELLFAETLGKGMKILEMQLRRLTTDVIPGSVAFLLYDTYGFPLDLTADIARERNLELDVKGFNQAMQQQRKLSQSANRFKLDEIKQLHIAIETEFTGYECTNGKANIKSIIGYDNRPVAQIADVEQGILVLDSSPFYPEGGGQVGDKGVISSVDSEFLVEDTQKQGGAILHFGRVVRGRFCVDQEVLCEVDMSRQAVRCNHSATHLLHQALRHILGAHVVQKGSLVDVDHLRFDFSHPEAIAANELEAIEIMVNTAIRNNVPLTTEINTLDEARNAGAMALFGEKYDTKVRVVTMGNFSKEVCGGTHVSATGDIGCFKILSESACAQGVRRIDAVTGRRAMDFMREEINRLGLACSTLNTSSSKLNERVFNLLDENKLLARECAQLKRNLASYQGDSLLSNVVKIGDYNVLSGMLENADRDTLRDTMDRFKDSLGNAVVLLATIDSATGKVVLVCGVSPSVQSVLKAPEVLKYVCSQIGGKGGGRPDFAQGGADSSEGLESALNSVESWVKGKV